MFSHGSKILGVEFGPPYRGFPHMLAICLPQVGVVLFVLFLDIAQTGQGNSMYFLAPYKSRLKRLLCVVL